MSLKGNALTTFRGLHVPGNSGRLLSCANCCSCAGISLLTISSIGLQSFDHFDLTAAYFWANFSCKNSFTACLKSLCGTVVPDNCLANCKISFADCSGGFGQLLRRIFHYGLQQGLYVTIFLYLKLLVNSNKLLIFLSAALAICSPVSKDDKPCGNSASADICCKNFLYSLLNIRRQGFNKLLTILQ